MPGASALTAQTLRFFAISSALRGNRYKLPQNINRNSWDASVCVKH
jgi:hypothetical protein